MHIRYLFSSNPRDFSHTSQKFPREDILKVLSERKTMLAKDQYVLTDYYPSDGELLALASTVYAEAKVIASPSYTYTMLYQDYRERLPAMMQELMGCTAEADELNWICLLRIHHEESDHMAAIYIHKTKPHLVMSFKGTQSFADWKEDISEIAYNNITRGSQYSAAREWMLKNLLSVLSNPAITGKYSVSLTGHSLGGWLANAILKDCEEHGFHFHLVTLDNPGTYEILSKLKNDASADALIARSDRTVYLSEPNLINCVHHHVPETRRLFPVLAEGYENRWYFHTGEAHSIKLLLAQFNESGRPTQYADVLNWPTLTPPSTMPVEEKRTCIATFFRAAKDYVTHSSIGLGFDAYSAYFNAIKMAFDEIRRHQPLNAMIDNSNNFQAVLKDTSHHVDNTFLECSARYKTRTPNPLIFNLASLSFDEQKLLEFLLFCRDSYPLNLLNDWFIARGYPAIAPLLRDCLLEMHHTYEGIVMPRLLLAYNTQGHQIVNFIKHLSAAYLRNKLQNPDAPESVLSDLVNSQREFLKEIFVSIAEARKHGSLALQLAEKASVSAEQASNIANTVNHMLTGLRADMEKLSLQLAQEQVQVNSNQAVIKSLQTHLTTLQTKESSLLVEKGKLDEVILSFNHDCSELHFESTSIMNVITLEEQRLLEELENPKETKRLTETDKQELRSRLQTIVDSRRAVGRLDLSLYRTTDKRTYINIVGEIPAEIRAEQKQQLREARERNRQVRQAGSILSGNPSAHYQLSKVEFEEKSIIPELK